MAVAVGERHDGLVEKFEAADRCDDNELEDCLTLDGAAGEDFVLIGGFDDFLLVI